MKKLRMLKSTSITFAEGCNRYLMDCRQRNLREDTIRHYRQSYDQFYKYFDPNMPIVEMDAAAYNGYVMHLRETLQKDVSINSYLRDLITTLHYLMDEGYLEPFKMRSIKVDKTSVDTYSEDDLKRLLRKPELRKCSFIEYQSWVITNFLFSTGVRQRNEVCISTKFLVLIDFSITTQTKRQKQDRSCFCLFVCTSL